MKTRNLFLLPALVLALSPLRAAEPAPTPSASGGFQTAVFTLRHASVKAVNELMVTLPGSFGGGSMRTDEGSRTILVIGPRELISVCTDIIHRLDVPPKPARNIQFTFYILIASQKAIPGGDCPPVISAFCEQMKGLYKGFRLLDTVSLCTREGQSALSKGIIPSPEAGGDDMPYSLRFSSTQVLEEESGKKPLIRLNMLSFTTDVTVRKDGQVATRGVGLDSSLDLREGQDGAVSTFSQGKTGESLCVVVRAKVLD